MSDTQIHHHEVHYQPAATDPGSTQIRHEALTLAIQATGHLFVYRAGQEMSAPEVTRGLVACAAEFERYITDGAPS